MTERNGEVDAFLSDRSATEQDVEHHYRLFLAREPESQAVVAPKIGQPLLTTILAFVTSDEFGSKLSLSGDVLFVDESMLRPLGTDASAWAISLFDITSVPDFPPDRLAIIRAVLAHPEIARALDAGANDGDTPSAVLVAALVRLGETAAVVQASALFDAEFYGSQLSSNHDIAHLALHYVLRGEEAGFKPSPGFDALAYRVNNPELSLVTGGFLHHFETVGRSQGRTALVDHAADHHQSAEIVRASPLFDEQYYRAQLGEGNHLIEDAAHHYVAQGERRGLQASKAFNAAVYADNYPDIASSEVNRLVHFESYGRSEGRAYRSWISDHVLEPLKADNGLPVVMLLLHEATYTGAPILGWNLVQALSDRCNVVVILRRDGALAGPLHDVAAAVVAAPPREAADDPRQLYRFARRLVAFYKPSYAIANSVETRLFAMALRDHDIPIVALVHEFWPAARPGVRLPFYADCAALVFPARLVEQSSYHAFREIRLQNSYILPQGPSVIPPFDQAAKPIRFGAPFVDDNPRPLEALLADGSRGSGPFTVIGLGAIELRKGVDLFIAAATALKARHPGLAFRFIWIGTWEHAIGTPYGSLLEEQRHRSGLDDELHFFPAVDNLDPVYDRANVLFLSSRLDPLPNITIDAAFRGIPVVCFDQASGMAELLSADADTAMLVVPHLDSGAAADCIATLAGDAALHASHGATMRRLAERTFDMASYARRLHELGCQAVRKFAATARDERLIDRAALFDASLYFGSDHPVIPAGMSPVAAYLDQTRHINFASAPVFGMELRRPAAGFHPLIYGNEAASFPRDGSRDALAHFVEQGMPPGRWWHPVLRPDLHAPNQRSPMPMRIARKITRLWQTPPVPVALHGHFHYPDNIDEFLDALAINDLRADLFLTTTSAATAEVLKTATRTYRQGEVLVETGPNAGRDIYSFSRVLRDHVQGRYEIVGHIHGKRSIHTMSFDQHLGNRWRRFLWEHLIGPTHRAADFIVQAMQRDERLGLVFPENDFLIGWEKNQASALALAQRLGLRRPLPGHIEFPVGTMFWARTAALQMLVDADLREDEMPPEPLPIDGTLLHALERMLPILVEEAGYGYATTYLPSIRR